MVARVNHGQCIQRENDTEQWSFQDIVSQRFIVLCGLTSRKTKRDFRRQWLALILRGKLEKEVCDQVDAAKICTTEQNEVNKTWTANFECNNVGKIDS